MTLIPLQRLAFFLMVCFLCYCSPKHKGGILPIFLDDYVQTTDERFFELKGELTGTLVNYQKAFECKDSTLYNSTSIIKLASNDTITVYSPCLTTSFEVGKKVTVREIEFGKKIVGQREIYVQFPKKNKNYPNWLCVSCRYPNTIGAVFSATD